MQAEKWRKTKVKSQQPKTALSVRQAAARLNYGLGWIYSLLYSGRLPAQKVGGKWQIPVSAVEDRLKQRGTEEL